MALIYLFLSIYNLIINSHELDPSKVSIGCDCTVTMVNDNNGSSAGGDGAVVKMDYGGAVATILYMVF